MGHWSLAQICKHLADSIHGSLDGFDMRNHRVKRFFLSKRLLRSMFEQGIPRGYTVDPRLTPPAQVDLDDAVSALDRAIARYQDHRGRLRPHPLFGDMPRETWNRVHRFHCAHHLSFVIPADG